MRIGLGHLRIAPSEFWRYSIKEWIAAVDGYMEAQGVETVEPFSRSDLQDLMEQFPDDRHTP